MKNQRDISCKTANVCSIHVVALVYYVCFRAFGGNNNGPIDETLVTFVPAGIASIVTACENGSENFC